MPATSSSPRLDGPFFAPRPLLSADTGTPFVPDDEAVLALVAPSPAPPPPDPWSYAQEELPQASVFAIDEDTTLVLGPLEVLASPVFLLGVPDELPRVTFEEELGVTLAIAPYPWAAPLPPATEEWATSATVALEETQPTFVLGPLDAIAPIVLSVLCVPDELPRVTFDEDAPALPAWPATPLPPVVFVVPDELPRVTFDEEIGTLTLAPAALAWAPMPPPPPAAEESLTLVLDEDAPPLLQSWVAIALPQVAQVAPDELPRVTFDEDGIAPAAAPPATAWAALGWEDPVWVPQPVLSALDEDTFTLPTAVPALAPVEPWRFEQNDGLFVFVGDEERQWVAVTGAIALSTAPESWAWDPGERAQTELEEATSRLDVASTWQSDSDPWRLDAGNSDAFFVGGDEDPFILGATRLLQTDASQPWKFESAREEVAPAVLDDSAYWLEPTTLLRTDASQPWKFENAREEISPSLLDEDYRIVLEPMRQNEPWRFIETHDDIAPGVLLDQDVTPFLAAIPFSKDLINQWDFQPDELPGPPEPPPTPPTPTPAPVTSIAGGSMGWSPWYEEQPRRRTRPLRGEALDDFLRELPGAAAMELAAAQAEEKAQTLEGRRRLVARLRKLVALSGSDNAHEATAAATELARMLREKGLVEELAAFLDGRSDGIDAPTAAVVTLLLTAAPSDPPDAALATLATEVRSVATEALATERAAEKARRARWTVALGASGAAIGLVVGGPLGALVGAVLGGSVGRSAPIGARRSSAATRRRR